MHPEDPSFLGLPRRQDVVAGSATTRGRFKLAYLHYDTTRKEKEAVVSWFLVVLGWLGMIPVVAVAISATTVGVVLPMVLTVGVLARAQEGALATDRATAPSRRRDARRAGAAA